MNDNSTYPKTDRPTLARLQSELDNINIREYGFNSYVNLASVIITWNVLQHFFPYFDVIDTDWNEPSVVSSGETMIGIIDHYNLGTTVGDLTAGCNGNFNNISLSCGYQVMWTGMKVLKHDGSQLYLKGFEPDYPVNKTIKAIKEGRDEYLENALEVTCESKIM